MPARVASAACMSLRDVTQRNAKNATGNSPRMSPDRRAWAVSPRTSRAMATRSRIVADDLIEDARQIAARPPVQAERCPEEPRLVGVRTRHPPLEGTIDIDTHVEVALDGLELVADRRCGFVTDDDQRLGERHPRAERRGEPRGQVAHLIVVTRALGRGAASCSEATGADPRRDADQPAGPPGEGEPGEGAGERRQHGPPIDRPWL